MLRLARMIKWTPVVVTSLLLVPIANAVDRFVDASIMMSGDGSEWSEAKKTLQEALDIASAGDVIWVADGTYVPTAQVDVNFAIDEVTNPCDSASRTYTFRLIPGVSMFGGFQGNSHPSGGETLLSEADPSTYLTILSGDLSNNDNPAQPTTYDDNAYHVLVYFRDIDDEEIECEEVDEPMLIDGFIITGGNASDGEQDPFICTGEQRNGAGGGAFIEFHACDEFFPVGPHFSRCLFENNSARIAGGGIATKKAGTTIIDCEFRENFQTENNPSHTMAVVSGGGAVSSVGPTTVLKSRFFENVSEEAGGGVITSSNTKVIDCDFRANVAPSAGGAQIGGVVVNSLFAGNVADTGNGGGLVGGDA